MRGDPAMEKQRQRTIKEHAEGVQRAFTQLQLAVAENKAKVEPKNHDNLGD
jgi:hypothetical protein